MPRERADMSTRLCIPQTHRLVLTPTRKDLTIRTKRDAQDINRMSRE